MTAVAVAAPRTRVRRRPKLGVGLLAAPVTVWLLFFFVAPFAVILWYSFGDKPSLYITHDNSSLSLGRYLEAFNPTFLAVFARTLQISVVGTLLCLLIAFPMAYWMAVKLPARLQGIAVALVLVPYWTNFLVRTIGWQIVLSPTSFVADISRSLGLGTPQLLYTTGAVQLGVVYNYLPLMILPLYVTMERLDHRLLEASRDLGAGAFETFRRVTLPIVMPGIAAGLLLVFVPLMGDYITPAVLGGARGSMIGQQVASQFNVAQNWALGSAMAIVLMLAIVAVVLVFALLFRLVRMLIDRHVQEPRARRRRTDAGTVLLGVWGVLGFLFLFFPVLVIVAYSFNEGRLLQSYRGFGLGAYRDALTNSAITSGVQVSIYVGVVSALVAAVLGSLAGVAVARRAGARWIGWLTALLGLVMVTPEIVNAVSLLPWFVTLGTDWGLTPVNAGIVRLVIAHSLFSCAVVTFIVRARMAGLSQSLEEAAADLGAPPLRPGALLSFTLSLDNTVLSSFVSTADATPFPVYVFASVRSSLRPSIAAMSTLMLLLTLVALALVAVVLIGSRRRTGEGMSLASTLAGG